VTPDGKVLPCHAAETIPWLRIENARDGHLAAIWYDSPSFNAFRGDEWMSETCRSCTRKNIDFGGCRCQAFMLTGSADNADPVCSKSPHHHKILEARREAACSDIKVSQLQFRNRTRSQLIFQTRDL
ncbi:SPASM domain-containing protein, partial [Staphylococcus aureus]|nr:SPASM domain-containing protein [Staphylococcus aureus]